MLVSACVKDGEDGSTLKTWTVISIDDVSSFTGLLNKLLSNLTLKMVKIAKDIDGKTSNLEDVSLPLADVVQLFGKFILLIVDPKPKEGELKHTQLV